MYQPTVKHLDHIAEHILSGWENACESEVVTWEESKDTSEK